MGILKKIWDKLPEGRPCCVPEPEAWIGEKRNEELNEDNQNNEAEKIHGRKENKDNGA